ncbi:sodium- and chloride-dependent GABA transporter 1-like [Tachypleus tridentatus]|uniref:sodium- and chloride-dependent GABA transporter 1-like n=1 Tax=Tachypleus tridentatus TaxID=6853 RepID=UPI003FD3F1F9
MSRANSFWQNLKNVFGRPKDKNDSAKESAENGHILPLNLIDGKINPTTDDGKVIDYDGGEMLAPPQGGNLPERGTWSTGKLGFIFGCLNYAVGLGNVWRFPYLCYENGGGAFLLPYFLSIIFCGIPLFLMEVSIGQYMSTGGIAIWNLVPVLKGIGFASMTMIGLCNIYYIVLIAYTLFYVINSFRRYLPWEKCGQSWNTENCFSPGDNITTLTARNLTLNETISPVKEYWDNHVLGLTAGLHDIGEVRMELVLLLLFAWVLVYMVIWRGLHQSGKIIWFTAIFPYVLLLVLFGRGITLEGASTGLIYYVKPEFDKLTDPQVWVKAGTQVLFSYGIGIGANVALGSYNKYHHNFHRDSLIVCCISSGTSLFSGLVIFSVLGHMAHVQNKDVSEVARSGPGLAFLAYPEVVVQLPLAPLWAVLFFLMLIVLGTDSQFCTVEAFVTGVVDEFPNVLRPRRKLFTFLVVVFQFILGIPLVTQGGQYLFQLMDDFSASGVTLLTVVFFEIVGFAWIYGAKQICRNIQDMIGFQPNYYFVFCWIVAAPVVIMGIFLFSVLKYDGVTYANIYKYPWWGEMIGWGMSVASIVWIPCYAIYYLLTTSGTLKERLKKGLSPVMVPSPVKELISVGTDENAEVQVAVVYKAEEEKPLNLN